MSPDLELLSERLVLATHGRRDGPGIAVLAIQVHPPGAGAAALAADLEQLDEAALARVKGAVRRADTVARIEPLRYVALLERLEEGAFAMRAAEQIVSSIRGPYQTANGMQQLVASVGISVHPTDGEALGDLLRCAEAALEAAHMSGGDLFGFYSGPMSQAAGRRVAVERALIDAVERRQLVLHYQPQIDSRDGTLVGVEALLRWHHGTLGVVSPVEFVPVLESLGLIHAAGDWVLHEACRQTTAWSTAGRGLRVCVNVSAHQLRRPEFENEVRDALAAAPLAPQHLELELTESVLLEDEPQVHGMLRSLRRDGVRVALDDFGTGYASLAYIRQFPMDCLKIDRQFVRGLPLDTQNAAITSAIIALARSLDLELVAEGVEQEAEEEFLHSLQCYVIQGFRYAQPMPPEELVRWREARPWA